MSAPAKSMYYFGFYLVFLGGTLALIPNVPFAIVGIPQTNEAWIRVVGMLILFLAFFCFQSARKELTEFMRWTVYTRPTVIIFFTVLALLGMVKPVVIWLGVIDLAAAIWTGLALRSAKTAQA